MPPVGSSTNYPTESYGTKNNGAGFITPYKVNSGVQRGTQIIANTDGSKILLGKIPNTNSFGIAFYDANGNLLSTQIGATSSDYDATGHKRVDNGLLPTGEYGTAYYDSAGNMIQKIVGGTTFIYDPSNNYTNIVQTGLLPDGSGGITSADPGTNVDDLYTA